MAEYIEREAAQKVAERYGCTSGATLGRHSGLADCIASEIEALPAADVSPVRHGRLVNANRRAKTYQRICTACGGIAYFCGVGCSYKFCPNCGAKMDGGDKNDE